MSDLTVEQRLIRAERQMRVQRWLMILMLAVSSYCLLRGSAFRLKGLGVDVISAREIQLTDDQEKVVALLTANGPRLALFQNDGKLRAQMSLYDDKPAFALFDAKEDVRASFSLRGKEQPSICFWDPDDTIRFSLSQNDDQIWLRLSNQTGHGSIALSSNKIGSQMTLESAQGRESIVTSVDTEIGPRISLYDKKGDTVATLHHKDGEGPGLMFWDSHGDQRVFAGVRQVDATTEVPGFSLLDDHKTARMRIQLGAVGAHFSMMDKHGQHRFAVDGNTETHGLYFYDAFNNLRLGMGLDRSNRPMLYRMDEDNKPYAREVRP